ncbi:MAG: methylated-DNA--[protein]-cysteine S-methyltransferase [Acidobacteriota bacterium]|nr:methylated-DNA--[protein]-cysteine S-methyltransferase [Acidobacteriota bacterium]
MYRSKAVRTPLGDATLASDGKSLTGLWLDNQKYHGGAILGDAVEKDGLTVFDAARDWLARYFAGGRPTPDELPLAPAGGEFRQGVWEILRRIPYGEVVTYGDIAKQMAARTGAAKMSGQAVGGAVGHNPISIVIPCHRVVGASGSLTGYGGGIWRKVKLLELEGVDMAGLFVPAKGTAL